MSSHNSKVRLRVAVLLAAYNGVDYIEEQISTLLNQSMVDVDVYISVDKSTDATEAVVLKCANQDSRVKMLPLGQVFGGAAPNFFRLMRDVCFDDYDYISLSDQDDLWFPDKLIRAHEVLTHNNADGYSSNVVAFWPNGHESVIEKSQAQTKWDFLFEAAGPGCTYVMQRDLAAAIKSMLISRWDDVQQVALHDWLIYAYSRANEYCWVIDDRPSMHYRQHANNQVGVNLGWRAFKYRVAKVLGGWGIEQASVIATLLNLDKTSFVRRWKLNGRFGLLWLALNANRCRRRRRDRFLFAMSCLLLSIMGRTHKR